MMSGMEKLVYALMRDEAGITREAYFALMACLHELSAFPNELGEQARKLLPLIRHVEAGHGRFWFLTKVT